MLLFQPLEGLGVQPGEGEEGELSTSMRNMVAKERIKIPERMPRWQNTKHNKLHIKGTLRLLSITESAKDKIRVFRLRKDCGLWCDGIHDSRKVGTTQVSASG